MHFYSRTRNGAFQFQFCCRTPPYSLSKDMHRGSGRFKKKCRYFQEAKRRVLIAPAYPRRVVNLFKPVHMTAIEGIPPHLITTNVAFLLFFFFWRAVFCFLFTFFEMGARWRVVGVVLQRLCATSGGGRGCPSSADRHAFLVVACRRPRSNQPRHPARWGMHRERRPRKSHKNYSL